MASSPRLDELEIRFNENPRRYFAPLANEYRKAGDVEHAIAICQAWLPQQPGHISGHIVYGQALFESGKLDEARGTFEAALGLDPENLIALRYLGDISRQRGEVKSARGWYQRVLDADPRNEEIAGLIASLDGDAPATADAEPSVIDWGRLELQSEDVAPPSPPSAATPPSVPTVESAMTLEIERASAERASSIDERDERDARERPLVLDIERASPEPEPDAVPRARDGGEFLDFSLADFGAESRPETPVVRPAPFDASASLDFELEAMSPFEEGRMARASDEAESALHSPTLPSEDDRELMLDDAMEAMQSEGAPPTHRPAETPPTAVGSTPAASVPAGELGLEPMEFVPPSREEQGTPLGVMEPDPFTGHLLGSTATPASPPPAAFVTETMAELYLQQGFLDDALTVYRQLLEQNPGDNSLRDRVEQLERGSRSSVSMASISDDVIESARARAGAPVIRTIRSFLGSIAARRAPRGVEPDPYAVAAMPDEAHSPWAAAATAEPPAGELGSFDLGLEPERPSGRTEREEALLGDVPLDLSEGEQTRTPSIDFGEDALLTAPAGLPAIRETESPIPEEIPPAMLSAMAELTPAEGMRTQPAPPAVSPSDDDDIPRRDPRSAAPPPASSLGGGTIDSLFGRTSGGADDSAAMTLARAFGASSSPERPSSLPGQPARTAKAELSLDQIFRDSPPPRGAPAGSAAAFSFDQFFSPPEPAADATRESGASSGGGAAPAGESDDIEQFNAWLEGLKKK